jgi:hypothetical protein
MLKQIAFVLANVAASFVLSALQVLLLPLLAFGMLVSSPSTSWALLKAWAVQWAALTAPFVVPLIATPSGSSSVLWSLYNTSDDMSPDQGMHILNGDPVPGMFEPQVKAVYDALGWRWKTWYWLAGRNVAYGFSMLLRPSYDFHTATIAVTGSRIDMTWRNGAVRQYNWPALTGPRFMFGYKLHNYLNGFPKAGQIDVSGVPFFTARLK